MKVSEFQEKLTTVSDSKLRLMLADSRQKGPEVAVKLILAEAERRGVDLNTVPHPADPGFDAASGSGPADAADPSGSGAADGLAGEAAGDPAAAPAGRGAWLAEEADQGMPLFVKLLLAVAVLGGIGFGLYLMLGKS